MIPEPVEGNLSDSQILEFSDSKKIPIPFPFPLPVPNSYEFGGVNLQFGGVKTKKVAV